MSASKVYFTDMRCPVGTGLLDKLKKLIEKAGIDSIDMDSKFVAIKIHFGEPGNLSFLRPNFAKVVADKVTSLGGRPFLTDCNTLYVGRRKHALEHLAAAQENGFSPLSTGCQMIIADGLKGTDEMEVPLEGCDHFQSAFIGRAIMDADIFISLTHFKGHELTGFGGAIKNIGMGCGSRAGKMAMHSIGKPGIDAEKCRGCKTCTHYCAQSAISIGEDHKARIDHDLCAGCGRCIGVCNFDAISNAFDAESTILNERMAEYTKAVIQNRPHFHVSIVNQVSPYCDCHAENDAAVVPDIGMFASFDPVALDHACIDAVNAAPAISTSVLGQCAHEHNDHFTDIHPKTNWRSQIEHARKIGIGNVDYELVTVKEGRLLPRTRGQPMHDKKRRLSTPFFLWPSVRPPSVPARGVSAVEQFFPEEFDVAVGTGSGLPAQDGVRHLFQPPADRAFRQAAAEGLLAHHGLVHAGVAGQHTGQIQRDPAQEVVADVREPHEHLAGALHVLRHVHADLEAVHAVLRLQHLDQGIGVRQGGGFRGQDEEAFLRRHIEIEHAVVDARARVHDEEIQIVLQLVHGIQQLQLLPRIERQHLADTRRGGQDGEAVFRGQQDVPQGRPLMEQVEDVLFGMQAQQHVHIGQPQVRVQKQHALAARRQGQGQIDRDIGLAHAPLARGDGKYQRITAVHARSRCQVLPFCYTYLNLFITRQIDSMLTSCFIEAGFTFSEKKARAFLSTGLHRGTHGIVS